MNLFPDTKRDIQQLTASFEELIDPFYRELDREAFWHFSADGSCCDSKYDESVAKNLSIYFVCRTVERSRTDEKKTANDTRNRPADLDQSFFRNDGRFVLDAQTKWIEDKGLNEAFVVEKRNSHATRSLYK